MRAREGSQQQHDRGDAGHRDAGRAGDRGVKKQRSVNICYNNTTTTTTNNNNSNNDNDDNHTSHNN